MDRGFKSLMINGGSYYFCSTFMYKRSMCDSSEGISRAVGGHFSQEEKSVAIEWDLIECGNGSTHVKVYNREERPRVLRVGYLLAYVPRN